MATLAVFVALGGTSYAVATGSIDSRELKDNSVRSRDVRNRSLLARDFRSGQLPAGPRGATGATGPRGATGPQGATGRQGDPAFSADCNEGLPAGDVMVRVGSVCIDRYEASIWDAPRGGNQITGALPCDANGQDCKGKIFARSVAGVTPTAFITWFQAQQALANSGKRLPSNAEWQAAVAGTPDSTACNVSTGSVASTGANAGCISGWGANDMVGNLWEWVADWDEQSGGCASWPAGFGDDVSCVGRGSGEPSTRFPGAVVRGGNFAFGPGAGPFAIHGGFAPTLSSVDFGFRGAR